MSKMNMWVKCGLYIVILGVWLELWKKFEEVTRAIVFDEELGLKMYVLVSDLWKKVFELILAKSTNETVKCTASSISGIRCLRVVRYGSIKRDEI